MLLAVSVLSDVHHFLDEYSYFMILLELSGQRCAIHCLYVFYFYSFDGTKSEPVVGEHGSSGRNARSDFSEVLDIRYLVCAVCCMRVYNSAEAERHLRPISLTLRFAVTVTGANYDYLVYLFILYRSSRGGAIAEAGAKGRKMNYVSVKGWVHDLESSSLCLDTTVAWPTHPFYLSSEWTYVVQ